MPLRCSGLCNTSGICWVMGALKRKGLQEMKGGPTICCSSCGWSAGRGKLSLAVHHCSTAGLPSTKLFAAAASSRALHTQHDTLFSVHTCALVAPEAGRQRRSRFIQAP